MWFLPQRRDPDGEGPTDVKPDASDQEIRDALGGVLCRCFAHTRMLRAILKYAEARRA